MGDQAMSDQVMAGIRGSLIRCLGCTPSYPMTDSCPARSATASGAHPRFGRLLIIMVHGTLVVEAAVWALHARPRPTAVRLQLRVQAARAPARAVGRRWRRHQRDMHRRAAVIANRPKGYGFRTFQNQGRRVWSLRTGALDTRAEASWGEWIVADRRGCAGLRST